MCTNRDGPRSIRDRARVSESYRGMSGPEWFRGVPTQW